MKESAPKHRFLKAAAIGVAGGGIDTMATTVWMHRSLTHKSFKLAKPLEMASRLAIWQGTGAIPRYWAAVHRRHHDRADIEGDPHSPIMSGRYGVLRILIKNPVLYKEAVKEERARELPADLRPDRLDERLFDNPKLGLFLGFLGHVAANKVVGNPGYMGAVSWGIEKLFYVGGGNMVNAIGHGGQHPFKAIVTGEIEPNEDGTYGADSRLVGAMTLGEGNQKAHHEHPSHEYFGDANLPLPERAVRDIGGVVAQGLLKLGLATKTEPPAQVA